jgi:hypothetical protein
MNFSSGNLCIVCWTFKFYFFEEKGIQIKAIPKFISRAREMQLGKGKGKFQPITGHEGPEVE